MTLKWWPSPSAMLSHYLLHHVRIPLITENFTSFFSPFFSSLSNIPLTENAISSPSLSLWELSQYQVPTFPYLHSFFSWPRKYPKNLVLPFEYAAISTHSRLNYRIGTHMQTLGRFCLLMICFSVLEFYKRFLYFFLGFFVMDCASCLKNLSGNSDFGCGFLVFGCFSRVWNLLVFFHMFSIGLKVLQYGIHCKGLIKHLCEFRANSSVLINRLSSKIDFGEVCESKSLPFKCGFSKLLKNSNIPSMDDFVESKELVNCNGNKNVNLEEDDDDDDDDDDEEEDGNGDGEEICSEDEVFDVMSLRKLIRIERRRANAACVELEKERMSAEEAAEEAMAMILRLQNEKSSIEMEAQQFRRMAEQKQLYDQEVIKSLRWMVMKHESERSLLEDQLRLCRQELKLFVKNDDHFEGFDPTLGFSTSIMDGGLNDVLVSSLEMNLPVL